AANIAESSLPSEPIATTVDEVLSVETEPVMADADIDGHAAAPMADEHQPDGQPQQIDEAPSIVPPIEQLAPLPTALPDPEEEHESFAARREQLRARRKAERSFHLPSTGVIIFMLVLVLGGLVGWRKTIVRYAPQTASLYAMAGMPVNLRGIVFGTVKTV